MHTPQPPGLLMIHAHQDVWVASFRAGERAADVAPAVRQESVRPGLPSADHAALFQADSAHAAHEERACAALSRLTQPLVEPISRWLATSPDAAVCVQTTGPAMDTVPWELLALNGRAFELHDAPVVRLIRGPLGAPPVANRVRVLAWCPDPKDALVNACVGSLPIHSWSRQPMDLPAPIPGVLDVVLLVGHGDAASGRTVVLGDEGEQDAATVSHSASGSLDGRIVLAGVCDGGLRDVSALGGLASGLVAMGAAVVCAPMASASPAVVAAFVSAFVVAMEQGQSVARAIAGSRRAIRDLACGFGTDRWYALRAFTSDPAALQYRVTRSPWSTDTRALEIVRVLDDATEIATSDGATFVGIEHVLAALCQDSSPTPVTSYVARKVRAWSDPSLDTIRAAQRLQASDRPARLAPRLQGLLNELDEDSELDALVHAIVVDPTGPFAVLQPDARRLMESASNATVASIDPQHEHTVPPGHAVFIWGPSDGVQMSYEVGQSVGRDPDDPDGDRGVSRKHVVRTPSGWQIVRPVRVRRGSGWERVRDGEITGGVVALSWSSWMLLGQ